MSFFRFAGNIAEGARQSDEKARGRRAKAIEAYDAFVRNNPEATLEDLRGRRGALSDGENYLFNALPDDPSITAQVTRNQSRKKIREEEEQMAGLERATKREDMIRDAVTRGVVSDLGSRYASPNASTRSDQEILAGVRKKLAGPLQKDFDRLHPAGYSLTDLRNTQELKKLTEAKAAMDMMGVMTTAQVERFNLPANLKPYALAVAAKNEAEQARLKRDEGRKDRRLGIAEAQQNSAVDNEMFRRGQVDLTRKIGQADKAEAQRLSRVKTSRELAKQGQEQAATQLKMTGTSLASALAESAGLDDDDKEIVTSNVQAIAEIYAVTETQIAEMAKIAVEEAETGSITSIKAKFEQKNGRLARRIDVVMQAGLGIETAPSVMTAEIGDLQQIETTPGSFTAGVVQNVQKVASELDDIANAATSTPDTQIQQAYQLQKNRIQALREALSLPGYNVTSGFDPSVINQLNDTVNEMEARLVDMQRTVKGTTPPPTPPPAQQSAAQQKVAEDQKKVAEDRKIADAVLEYQMASISSGSGMQIRDTYLDRFIDLQFPNATWRERPRLLARAKQMLTDGQGTMQRDAGNRGAVYGGSRYRPAELPD